MTEAHLLHELVNVAVARSPGTPAPTHGKTTMSCGQVEREVRAFVGELMASGSQRTHRVAIYLEKCFEVVVESFGTACTLRSSKCT